jgi:hypothetical protein
MKKEKRIRSFIELVNQINGELKERKFTDKITYTLNGNDDLPCC